MRGFLFFSCFLLLGTVQAKETSYTGSTPAGAVVRDFLGIPQTDSLDFIRWHLTVNDRHYTLECNYGIGKANTNGFIGGGSHIRLNGNLVVEANNLRLVNGSKALGLVAVNNDLLHFADASGGLLVGNGGWSYTLNNRTPSYPASLKFTSAPNALQDSMVFVGRTPCGIPGLRKPGLSCYKLKWKLTLYSNGQKVPMGYRLNRTDWRRDGDTQGAWQITSLASGQTLYQLNDANGQGYIYLLPLSHQLLVFTAPEGRPLVGNEDFSYTLNGTF